MMAYIPFLALLGFAAVFEPAALPYVAAYFIMGMALASWFVWLVKRHPCMPMPYTKKWYVLAWLYGWPGIVITCLICAFYDFRKGKSNG